MGPVGRCSVIDVLALTVTDDDIKIALFLVLILFIFGGLRGLRR